MSPATVNHYNRAVRAFFRWMVKAKRMGSNPVDTLELVNERADIRRQRRALTADELRRVIETARGSGKTFRGLTGEDRAMLYLAYGGT
jgi:site-specific recombinase XerC